MAKARRIGALAGIGLVIAVLLLSHRFGRADPTGAYRPDVPPDALATGCFPLPGGVTLDFGYQIRRDGDVEVGGGVRRILVGQYDEIDEPEALDAIIADFVEAGFVEAGFVEAEGSAPYDAVLRKDAPDGSDVVGVIVTQLPDIEADVLVRGTFVLDLPVAELPEDPPEVCSDQDSTKRFVPWWRQP